MKFLLKIVFTVVLIGFSVKSHSQIPEDLPVPGTRPTSYAMMEVVIENGDTIFVDFLRPLYVYPPLVFSNRNQEKFYWRTVRDVKKALPYARLASIEINNLNRELFLLNNDAARKRYINDFQKRIFREYEKPLRNLTVNQGKMLVKLIDREYGMNTYDLIRAYKGSVPAVFWNTVAKFFGSDLKAEYDGSDKDRIVERVITLVDAGQL
ncbi:MAG: DUF4294 domain-containing protein [Porphyromonadaceae bacterium]|jgi:hypothetical protein|nr:DUF4294 domain-containing protein [Porphyromonadaceae bacterium]